jgi:hypothetical protein
VLTSFVGIMPKPSAAAAGASTNLSEMRSRRDADSAFRDHVKNVGEDVSTIFIRILQRREYSI